MIALTWEEVGLLYMAHLERPRDVHSLDKLPQ
jgi:hypothetical protein